MKLNPSFFPLVFYFILQTTAIHHVKVTAILSRVYWTFLLFLFFLLGTDILSCSTKSGVYKFWPTGTFVSNILLRWKPFLTQLQWTLPLFFLLSSGVQCRTMGNISPTVFNHGLCGLIVTTLWLVLAEFLVIRLWLVCLQRAFQGFQFEGLNIYRMHVVKCYTSPETLTF